MINPALITPGLRDAAGALVVLGLALSTGAMVGTGEYPGHTYVARYEAWLDRMIRLLFLKMNPKTIIMTQVLGVAGTILGFVAFQEPYLLLGIPLSLALPAMQLYQERAKRHKAFEEQSDTFLMALGNSLKAVPSIGGAITGVLPVLQDPIRQEMLLVLNEVRLGNTIEQALLNAAARAQSQSFDAAVSALLVGRQVGGNLPKILEMTSGCIREMNRLDGHLKSKTAEGKAQLWVLALFPAFIIGSFKMIKPDYFDPLQYTELGQLISAFAVGLWVAALLIARKFSQVDI